MAEARLTINVDDTLRLHLEDAHRRMAEQDAIIGEKAALIADLRSEVALLRERIGEVVAMLLRGGTTDTDRRRSALAALTRPADDVCGHGVPRALVDCEKCETAWKANADA